MTAFLGLWSEWVERESTEYAKGFSRSKFAKVKTGASADDVARSLGEPLGRSTASDKKLEYWFYSRSPSIRTTAIELSFSTRLGT